MKKKRNKNLKRKKWEGKSPKFLTTQNLRKKKKMKYMVKKRRRKNSEKLGMNSKPVEAKKANKSSANKKSEFSNIDFTKEEVP